jgi:cobalt-zinc-cadmium efflux system outer membrane protein
MKVSNCAPTWLLVLSLYTPGARAQDWTEAKVVQKFLEQSPYAREARARIESVRAEAVSRTLLQNPSAVASREGAGYTAFFQLEQQLPLSGRRALLRQAGTAAVSASEAQTEAILWSLRSDVRLAFYRLIAAQRREAVLNEGLRDLMGVVQVLRTRENEGEGSRYDRLRAEREVAEYRSQLALVHSDVVRSRTILSGFLPGGTQIESATGGLETPADIPALEALTQRALARRSEYIAEQRQLARFVLEQRAAQRLRYPEPVAIAGIKRGSVALGRTETSSAIGITVPLPLFNKGQAEVSRWRAEQEGATARRDALERRIRAEVIGAAEALRLRKGAIEQYRTEVNQAGTELSRIVRVAYEEGEAGILELLDSYRVTRQALLRLVDLEALAKESQIELDRAVGEEVLP